MGLIAAHAGLPPPSPENEKARPGGGLRSEPNTTNCQPLSCFLQFGDAQRALPSYPPFGQNPFMPGTLHALRRLKGGALKPPPMLNAGAGAACGILRTGTDGSSGRGPGASPPHGPGSGVRNTRGGGIRRCSLRGGARGLVGIRRAFPCILAFTVGEGCRQTEKGVQFNTAPSGLPLKRWSG